MTPHSCHPTQSVFRISFQVLFTSIFTLVIVTASSQETFYPKEEGGKWGIAATYQVVKKKELVDQEKWILKPQWDMIWRDTTRYGCYKQSMNCEGFFTLKNGKYGYIWKNGNRLENEYESINITRHVAKKNGKWGAFSEHIPIVPFEFDSLVYHLDMLLYENKLISLGLRKYDTSYKYFGGLKNGNWSIILVKIARGETAATMQIISQGHPDFYPYQYGALIKTGDQWQFMDLRNSGKPVYAASYDTIKTTGELIAVKKQGKWYLVHPENPDRVGGKGWDDIDKTEVPGYLQVWENGQVGIVLYENNFLKEIFKPKGTAVKLIWKTKPEDMVFVFTVDGRQVAYDRNAKILSTAGDVTVKGSRTQGPFRIEEHDTYGYYTVYDAATNEVLIPKSKMGVYYSYDPNLGHILNLEERMYNNNVLYGMYHYNTKTFIKPQYASAFRPLGSLWIIYRKYGEENYQVWEQKTMKLVDLPFVVKSFKDQYQYLLRDQHGQWHEAEAPYAIVPPSKVIRSRQTILGGIEMEETEDNSKTILRLNGQTVNLKVEASSMISDGKIFQLTVQGKTTEYFERNGQAVACSYNIPAGSKVLEKFISYQPWPGNNFRTPVILMDSSHHLVLVNMYNNKRLKVPVIITEKALMYENRLYEGTHFSVCLINSHDDIRFCGFLERKCGDCKNGSITKTVKETIKGQTTYTTKRVTSYKTETERRWDPRINGYRYVEVSKPVTSYETVAKTAPDRVVEKTVTEKCGRCNGTSIVALGQEYTWDGKTLKKN